MKVDISKLSPPELTAIVAAMSDKDIAELFTNELAAMLHVYGYTGHPGRAGDICMTPKRLLLEAAKRISNQAPVCAEQDCEPPCGDKEACEFYRNGLCAAKRLPDEFTNRPLTLKELQQLTGKYIYWDDRCGGDCLVAATYVITPSSGTFSLDWVASHGKAYRFKPKQLTQP